MDSNGLPSILDNGDVHVQGDDKECPDFGRNAITSQVGHCPEYYLIFATIFDMLFPIIEVATVGTRKWRLWRAGLEK